MALSILRLVLVLLVSTCAWAADKTELPGGTVYPRVLRVQHGQASSIGHVLASTTGHIFESDDDGRSFRPIATITPRAGSKERCCATLYELPQAVGSLPAGTLLYSASFLHDEVPSIEVYASSDEGKSWRFHSTVVQRGDHAHSHGLWEPQFLIAKDGALAVLWSDETDPCCSQKLAQARSYDGATWKDETDTVATTVHADRPGMAVVTPLPDHSFFLTYEICGPYHCAVFARSSQDGWHWGEPRDIGRLLRTADGSYLEHAPANFWIATETGGVMLVTGQLVIKGDGSVDPVNNGRVLFSSREPEGWGTWTMVQAPIDVPRSYDNYCPNYSSALLPVESARGLLELASDYDAVGTCRTYFAIEPLHSVLDDLLFTPPKP